MFTLNISDRTVIQVDNKHHVIQVDNKHHVIQVDNKHHVIQVDNKHHVIQVDNKHHVIQVDNKHHDVSAMCSCHSLLHKMAFTLSYVLFLIDLKKFFSCFFIFFIPSLFLFSEINLDGVA